MIKLKKMSENKKLANNHTILTDTGLIAISLIILQDYISIGISDTPILISLIAFSIALPLLSGSIILRNTELEYQYYDNEKYKFNIVAISDNIGILCAII